MTSSLPREIRNAFEGFITTEFTTIDAGGQPITWPVTPYYSQGASTIDVTTGIGYPKKANDAKRNPRVSLLFSDPTGFPKAGSSRVLVQGTADVDDENLDANHERYRRESAVKLPSTKDMYPPKPLLGLFHWYFARVYVKVRPERVFVWPDGDFTAPLVVHDAHLEEVRSGHSEEPAANLEPAAGGATAWDERIEQLGKRHTHAVISWVAPDGFPLSVRLPVRAEPASHRIEIESEPAGVALAEGRACVVAHRHDPEFTWQENFQVRGDLFRDGDSWALVPHKLVGGFELPKSKLKLIRANFQKSLRYAKTAREEMKRRRAAGR